MLKKKLNYGIKCWNWKNSYGFIFNVKIKFKNINSSQNLKSLRLMDLKNLIIHLNFK